MYIRFYTRLIFFLLIRLTICLNIHNSSFYTLYYNNITSVSKYETNSSKWVLENGSYGNETKNNCIETGYEKICSGHGRCNDGICSCDKLKSQENDTEFLYEYSGKFCEECPYCKGQICQKLLPCVESILRNLSGDSQCYIYYSFVENIKLDYNDKLCQVEEANRCMITFKYFYDDNSDVFIDIEREIKCLNGKQYIVFCWCVFLIYIVALMTIFKMV